MGNNYFFCDNVQMTHTGTQYQLDDFSNNETVRVQNIIKKYITLTVTMRLKFFFVLKAPIFQGKTTHLGSLQRTRIKC